MFSAPIKVRPYGFNKDFDDRFTSKEAKGDCMNWIVMGMEFPANQYVTNPTPILAKHPPNYNGDSGSHF